MLPLHHPDAPRHARMFEFLRQSHQAELTSNRLSNALPLQTTRRDVEDWRAVAIQSLQVQSAPRAS